MKKFVFKTLGLLAFSTVALASLATASVCLAPPAHTVTLFQGAIYPPNGKPIPPVCVTQYYKVCSYTPYKQTEVHMPLNATKC